VANIRRGLERIGKVIKVWGYLVTIPIIGIIIYEYFRKFHEYPYGEVGQLEILVRGGIIAWAPFLAFKLLFWIGSGFVGSDDEEEKPSD